MTKNIFVGLDLETDGNNIDDGAVPIEIGLSLGTRTESNYTSLIGWDYETYETVSGPTWNTETEKVHGISQQRIIDCFNLGIIADKVDEECYLFLQIQGVGPREAVAVGWNVGSYDFPFVRRYLPLTETLFSYRFVDLNSVVFSMAEASRRDARDPNNAWGYAAWKKRAKANAEKVIGGSPGWHRAGYDATASLLAWYWLCDQTETRRQR